MSEYFSIYEDTGINAFLDIKTKENCIFLMGTLCISFGVPIPLRTDGRYDDIKKMDDIFYSYKFLGKYTRQLRTVVIQEDYKNELIILLDDFWNKKENEMDNENFEVIENNSISLDEEMKDCENEMNKLKKKMEAITDKMDELKNKPFTDKPFVIVDNYNNNGHIIKKKSLNTKLYDTRFSTLQEATEYLVQNDYINHACTSVFIKEDNGIYLYASIECHVRLPKKN